MKEGSTYRRKDTITITTLRQYRKAKKYTQVEVAAFCGASQVAVSAWELGNRHPRPPFVARLERLLGADIETLMAPADTDGAAPKSSAAQVHPTAKKEKNRDTHSTN